MPKTPSKRKRLKRPAPRRKKAKPHSNEVNHRIQSVLIANAVATYIDRFDRKRLLLVIFALFALSNLGCAMAATVNMMLLARAFAGLTGGVLGSIVMAVLADVVPPAPFAKTADDAVRSACAFGVDTLA